MDHLWALLQVFTLFSSRRVLAWGTEDAFHFPSIFSSLLPPHCIITLFTLWSSCCFPNCSLLIFSTLNFLFFWSCTSPNWIPCAESWQQLLGRPPYQKHQKAVRLSQCNRGSVKHLHYPSGTARGKKINTCLKKNKHKNSLRRQSASIVQRKYSYNHSRRQGKYPHLEKVVFHCIVCTQSHLCLWWDFCVFPEQLRVRTYSAGISRSSAETRVSKLAHASTK